MAAGKYFESQHYRLGCPLLYTPPSANRSTHVYITHHPVAVRLSALLMVSRDLNDTLLYPLWIGISIKLLFKLKTKDLCYCEQLSKWKM